MARGTVDGSVIPGRKNYQEKKLSVKRITAPGTTEGRRRLRTRVISREREGPLNINIK